MEKELKYEQAMRELEAIVRKMENNELDIDMLGAELKRAQTLIKICKDKLTKADNEVKNVLKNCEE
ncbi:exodeoxyribonuclease VII small subunit [Prevotella sp. P2-180]|uniref:exodeoxyribonuclease VII small subunit n=1 Tax=Prevotella sp. P2-180 TaxID=2024224 RepID=UPI000B96B98C|nr:exodeoxyribonuclease VII small subunit [Prevotella sp. P2-180]MCI6337480.1 exodeoxyribonuclease VII small subunit [Prevotella sp.]MCI7089181.1 exodeoxyribonuclease VII small subunit [Prevotella sp.]MCI7256317.1 exodeoxyribonuclease VII small subunit [Prevotella sp.]MDD5783723.1 exodeoxyribonuclease VII small subunit [Prevotella sp.]MDD6863203.1 exodeoxyribonuclease VII small subunit [Prevotella sp.]